MFYIVITVPDHEYPIPNAAISTLSPFFALPHFIASARAIGIDAETSVSNFFHVNKKNDLLLFLIFV
jgi:hypothetical protein